MAPRRGPPSANTLSPQEPLAHSSSASPPAFPSMSRANSPSSGFTQFLSKPSKWFNRNASNPRTSAGSEPRSSTSSGRKPKISSPSDPRLIVNSLQSETYVTSAARSVLDLSSTKFPMSLDMPAYPSSGAFSSPPSPSTDLGDLRSISRRPWSRSVDDLGRMSPGNVSPLNTHFQDKITQYRHRTNSNVSPPPHAISTNFRQPFPSINNPNSPGSSPPRESLVRPSGVSISVSAPTVESDSSVKAGPAPPTQAHIRSHSFTPRLASKLTPRLGPASPKRTGTGDSDREFDKDADSSFPGQGNAAAAATRGPFPFSFGGGHNQKPLAHEPVANPATYDHSPVRSTTLLAPPTIVEPGRPDEDGEVDKRSSQFVYNTGFINLQSNTPPPLLQCSDSQFPHSNLILTKGWKPFKLELKGSKIYFYKPPGDRNAAIKELFPTELVPVLEDEEVVGSDDTDVKNRKTKDLTAGRKKRAYWGRKTHPDLVHSQRDVESGTFEALIHETVFATIFLAPSASTSSENPESTESVDKHTEEWKDFASAILLCLPLIVGQARFQNEFTRCCAYLVNGAKENMKEEERARVSWLAGEYLRHHDSPADIGAWDEWRADIIPDACSAVVRKTVASAIPNSSSMQALFAPSPQLGSGSPNIGTFSPRPDDTKMQSLVEALGVPQKAPSPQSSLDFHANAGHPVSSQIPWAALGQQGLSRDLLLSLDSRLIARSLCLFHRGVLELAPENLPANIVIGAERNKSTTSLNHDGHDRPMLYFKALFGSEEHPHWLTKLLLMQILGADTTGHVPNVSPSTSYIFDERNMQTSRTHSRSEVISVWVKIGELCRLMGDECSWRAIAAALCSRPVARLDKVWKRVDVQALVAVESWVFSGPDGECASVNEPRVTPWGGDVMSRIDAELSRASVGDGEEAWNVSPFHQLRGIFNDLRTTFSLCPRKSNATIDDLGQDIQRMVAFWRDKYNGRSGITSTLSRVDQFMPLSLAAEPRRKGLYEPYFWSRSSTSPQSSRNALVPLLFPEPLPGVTFIDRGLLSRSRVDYDLNDHELSVLRSIDEQLRRDEWLQFPGFDSQDRTSFGGVHQGGTIILVYNGELLLVVQGGETESASLSPSRPPSRPPSSIADQTIAISRAPSFRVKSGSPKGLEKKSSTSRRNSLPAKSHRQSLVPSEPSSEPPLRVLVQAGTLERLVYVLVHGLQNVSISVADDNGEVALREGKTRELIVDRAEFAKVWWNTFRSFVTPFVFFQLLRKLYIQSQPVSPLPSADEYLTATRHRSEVLGTINEWVCKGGGAQDALDDIHCFNAISSFLDGSIIHVTVDSPHLQDPTVDQAWHALQEAKDALLDSFLSQTKRPTRTVYKHPVVSPRNRKVTQEASDIDRIDPDEFVDHLDGMAYAAYGHVTEEDLFITSDLLEVQTADRTGWFPVREVNWNDETVEIQSIYSLLREVQPSPMISELGHDTFYRLLPPSIRSCIRAYGILRKWLIMKLVGPRLGLRVRQARMDLFLRAIEIARLRNTETAESTLPSSHRPCVRSFVETVLASAILSVESRTLQRAWQNLALSRGVQCDSLSSLFFKPSVQSTNSKEALTVDIGWIIERMLEIITTTNVVESLSEETPQMLVNYSKRRRLCNLILSASSLTCSRRVYQRDDTDRMAFERLNNIEREVNLFQFDLRAIKEEAHREAMYASANGNALAKRVPRPFQKLVALQIEKNKRDRNLRDRLIKEKRMDDMRSVRREDLFNKNIRPSKLPDVVQKQRRNKKSMSSAFMHFMRPISSAFTSETLHSVGPKRSPSELDFAASGKPSLVVSLVEARVAQFINNERSFTFQIDAEDGGRYLLQAVDRREMVKWMDTISQAARMAAKRRLTYLGNSPKPQPSDHIYNRPLTVSRDPTAVFGVELGFLLQREAGHREVHPGAIPSVLEQCLSEIESRGLSEVGIYRIAGATKEISALRDAFNRGESPIDRSTDIHAVCDLVKSWFRLLPEPVFPSSSYHGIIEAMKLDDFEIRLAKIRSIVRGLPQANFDLLKRVAEHLENVTDYEEDNQMTAEALAIVFSPNLMRAPQNDFVMILANMTYTHKLVKALITHFNVIFNEVDPEAEMDQEEEYDSPILEEDEDEDEEDIISQPVAPEHRE